MSLAAANVTTNALAKAADAVAQIDSSLSSSEFDVDSYTGASLVFIVWLNGILS